MVPRSARPVVSGAAVVALALTGCSSSSPSPDGADSPLTGRPGPVGRLLAVKVDNVGAARPQTGVNSADVVYATEVEGGLSRLIAVFDSEHLPPGGGVGPVRSARETDLEVLRQYGRVAFAYSGAQRRLLPVIARADLVDCPPARAGSAYVRDRDRPAPSNEFLRPSAALRDCPGAARARDVGFRFGAAPSGGTSAPTFTARMPAASLTFTWSASRGQYLVAFDGAPARTTDGGTMSASTVVVQRVTGTTSPRGLRDSSGGLSPFSPTVGSGAATVLRDGRAYRGAWSRPRAADGTEFTFRGERMRFRPGRVWVVLEPR